jgi:hypothetical protein
MRVVAETATVLVTVKATPSPSTSYGDTVCVAGLRLDGGRPSWIRLYPIAFRWLDDAAQFKKYDVIEVEVRRRDKDTRHESYSPTEDSIRVVRHLEPWAPRHEILQHVATTTTCELAAAGSERDDAPSLGLVRVAEKPTVTFEPHDPWNEDQIRKMAQRDIAAGAQLFESGSRPPALVAPRLKMTYRYRCLADDCPGHVGRNLDWELTAFQNRNRHLSDDDLKAAIEKRFVDMMFKTSVAPAFFMGNFEMAKMRGAFTVLGTYYPPVGVATSSTLF